MKNSWIIYGNWLRRAKGSCSLAQRNKRTRMTRTFFTVGNLSNAKIFMYKHIHHIRVIRDIRVQKKKLTDAELLCLQSRQICEYVDKYL